MRLDTVIKTPEEARPAQTRGQDGQEVGRSHGHQRAVLLATSGQFRGRLRAVFHGRRHIAVAAVASLLVAGGIFALRASVEGSLAGLVYGCLAGAITLASFINAYMYADEIADQVDNAKKTYTTETGRAKAFAGDAILRQHNEASAEATSIQAEHAKRGEAAVVRFRALKWRAMRGNPGVMGHGFAPEVEPPIGRRALQGTNGQEDNE